MMSLANYRVVSSVYHCVYTAFGFFVKLHILNGSRL